MASPETGETPEAQSPGLLRATVVYALPEEQHIVSVVLPAGSTVEEAVHRSGLLQRFPTIAARPLHCAVFNRVVGNAEEVRAGDRVEILRALQVDPKEQRRREAARARGKH
jgi:putative ubiquitin-RnfH superfamily antitoxin RatB of RatAB toxin-antitoxin module